MRAVSAVGVHPTVPTTRCLNLHPQGLGTQALTLNLMYLWPVWAPQQTFAKFHQEVTTASSSGFLRAGLYKNDYANGGPLMSSLLWDGGQVSSGTTGMKSWTSQTIPFPGGIAWFALVAQTSACTIRSSLVGSLRHLIMSGTPAANTAYGGRTLASVTGALPTSGSPADAAFTQPYIFLEAA